MENINPNLFPVLEWAEAKFAIMGGLSNCDDEKDYFDQYINYLEVLSKTIPVKYFTNKNCKEFIKSKIDTTRVDFVDYTLNSIWIRDYAPIWLENSQTGGFSIVDFPYGANHFNKSNEDDQFSKFLSKYLNIPMTINFPRKQIPFYFDGGNLHVDEEQFAYTSIRKDDPPEEYRRKLLAKINCEKIVILEHIPSDPTGHVDMYLKILPEKKALLASYSRPVFKEAMLKNKKILIERGFEVIDLLHIDKEGFTNWSYANSVLVGSIAFVPEYGFEKEDLSAKETYENLGYEVQMIPADKIVKEKGSLHCITNFIY